MIMLTQLLILLVGILISVAFFSLFERKLMGLIQARKGPNKISLVGFLQPMADALKLLTKFDNLPFSSPPLLYSITPLAFLSTILMYWTSLPIKGTIFFMQSSFLFVIFCLSLPVYLIIFLGWFSNSKYSTIGSVRAIVQSISYEINLSFLLFSIIISSMSVNFSMTLAYQNPLWFIFPLSFVFLPLFISILAETNRSPFDLTEGESELVSGYCVEYGSISYTLIFLGENSSILFMSMLISLMFMNYSKLAMVMIMILFVWIRASLPRIRFDEMMKLCWMKMLPISIFFVLFVIMNV